MTKEKLNRIINALIRLRDAVTDDVAFASADLYSAWRADKVYETGDRLLYNGELYKVLQGHTSLENWTPDTATSLYVRINDPAIEWPEWIQPLGAHDAYTEGDKVSHNGKHWISTMNYNTYAPGVYGWREAT